MRLAESLKLDTLTLPSFIMYSTAENTLIEQSD